jgi:hypothetical protein
VLSMPGLPASLIYITFALFPGDPWYEAHPSIPGPTNSLGKRICIKTEIDGLRLEIERHEGITMATRSHFGIEQDLLRRWRFARQVGAMVSAATGTPESIRQQVVLDVASEWKKFVSVLTTDQDAFDGVDVPAIFAALGCGITID